jgi:hypothetical protein
MRNANLKPAMRALVAATLLMVAACSTTGTSGFQGRYLPDDIPEFKGKGQVMIVIPDGKRDFMWAGKASSWIGSDSTLVLPLGTIVETIATDVFGTHFSGVQFVPTRPSVSGCDVAIEGDMDQFIYSYTRLIESGFEEENQESWIVPEVDIAFIVRAYGAGGTQILEKTYSSGPVAGRRYLVSSNPGERINEALHGTLHDLMDKLAADISKLQPAPCRVDVP